MAARYWVGGTGNWNASDTTHWSASTGGANGASVPTSSDDVFFDANSGTGTCTLLTAAANCNNFDASATSLLTIAGSVGLSVYGNFTLKAGMTMSYTGTITFAATAMGKLVTSGVNTLNCKYNFNGVGGGWTFQDEQKLTNSSSTLYVTNGTLNTNGQTVTVGYIFETQTGTKTLNLGASTIRTYNWNFGTTTGLTFNAGTSTISGLVSSGAASFDGGGLTYNNVSILISSSNMTITGANTYANLTLTNSSVKTAFCTVNTNQIITGTLTITGASVVNRIFFRSSTLGTVRTITAAAVSLTNVDFRDITAAGAASPFSGTSLGDCLGNTNITMTGAVTRYWVGNAGSWSDTTHWSASSGGASGASVPLSQDTVIFDANSIISGAQTITVDMPRMGADITFANVTNSPVLNLFGSTADKDVFGAFTLGTMTTSGTTYALYLYARSAKNLDTKGVTLTGEVLIYALNGSYTLQSDFVGNFSTSGYSLNLTYGTLDSNGYAVTVFSFGSSNSNTRVLTMGASTWTLNGYSATFSIWFTSTVTNFTLNRGTSTIVINDNSATRKQFSGGGKIYGNLNLTGSPVTIVGSNTWNNFTVSAGKTLHLTSGNTQTIQGVPTLTGTVGNLITIDSTTGGSRHTLSKSSGVVECDYMSIQDSNATGGAAWYAGSHSTNVSNNLGWIFADYRTKTFTADGIVVERLSKTFTADGIIVNKVTKTFTADGIIREIKTQTFTVDGIIKAEVTKTFTADGIVIERITQTFTADGIIKEYRYRLDTLNLPRPKYFKREFIYVKTDMNTIDGSTKRDVGTFKEKFILGYEVLTQAEISAIQTIIDTNAAVSFEISEQNLNINSTNVFPSIKVKSHTIPGADYRAAIELELLEVS